ncbi:MAG: DUF1365 domain-containing protein [Bacteroidetes bacterium]|nr:DUF1365 domain-containing protein [Bacteroidota bacterium]
MNSCLYDGVVMHHRLRPLRNRFVYSVYMFYLDLDELDDLHRNFRFFSRNRFNLYSFRDADHLRITAGDLRANVVEYLRRNGVTADVGRIMLLTNVRVLGYVFNPVSFYYCYDRSGQPLCAVPEVGNTFGEQKAYFMGADTRTEDGFRRVVPKMFYVSPFVDLDTTFEFHLRLPGDRLQAQVDDLQDGDRFFLSALTGVRKPLTDGAMLYHFFRIPFITLKVIWLIHWQALKLWRRKLPFRRKTQQPELQQDILLWNK